MTDQLELLPAARDTRVKVYETRGCCSPCWCARCTACGKPLTKHAFAEDDAYREALNALDVAGHFQHRCTSA